MVVDVPMLQFFGLGGSLRVSWYGDNLPSRDFPLLANYYLSGELDLDRVVSTVIGLEDTEAAFEAMERGETLRSVYPDTGCVGILRWLKVGLQERS